MDLGQKLTMACDRRGLSQRDVARACGVSNSTVNRWLAGEIAPRLDEAVTLSRLLGVPVAWLADDGDSSWPDRATLSGERAWLEVGRRFGFDSAFRVGDEAADKRLHELWAAYTDARIAELTRDAAEFPRPDSGASAAKKRRGG